MIDQPEKFLFDLNDFSTRKAVTDEDEENRFSEDELNAAREESFKLGANDATQKIREEHEERSLQTLETLTQQLVVLLSAEVQRESDKNLDTARLTLSIIKKLVPHFAKKYAEEEIIALVKQSLGDRADEPRLVVTVHDTMLETLRKKIDDVSDAHGFRGQVIIIADENIKPVDCRVEWADGGIEKNFDVLYSAIESAFHSVLHRLDLPQIDAAENEQQTEEKEIQDD